MIFHQLLAYVSWKPDSQSRATDVFQQRWSHLYTYAFPPFCLMSKVLKKVGQERVDMILITPLWQTQPWYSQILEMCIKESSTTPSLCKTLQDPLGRSSHPRCFVKKGVLKNLANFTPVEVSL